MSVTAVSIMANDKNQALLLREGGWGKIVPRKLMVTSAPHGTVIYSSGIVIGLAQASAMGALISCLEFHLGEVCADGIRQLGKVHVKILNTSPSGGQ